MNEIEEIVRDRIVIELEKLKSELEKEAKQRRVEGEITEDMYLKYKLFHEADGIKDAIKKINKRLQEKNNVIKYQTCTFSFFLYIFLSFFYYISY